MGYVYSSNYVLRGRIWMVDLFVSVSRAGEDLLPLAQQFSQEWSIPFIRSRPLPQEGLGLIFQKQGLALYAPPKSPKQWHPGFVENRWRTRDNDPLIRALGGTFLQGMKILDGTLGMGHDALLMARCGAQVLAYEQNPLIAYYTLKGLARYDLDAATRIHIRVGDHIAHPIQDRVDFVYLDPMFPAPSSQGWRSSPTLATLRSHQVLELGASRAETLLCARIERALYLARQGVIIKLAPNEDHLHLPQGVRTTLIQSHRVRLLWIQRSEERSL